MKTTARKPAPLRMPTAAELREHRVALADALNVDDKLAEIRTALSAYRAEALDCFNDDYIAAFSSVIDLALAA